MPRAPGDAAPGGRQALASLDSVSNLRLAIESPRRKGDSFRRLSLWIGHVAPYCLGARLIAEFEADRMGIGMPFSIFEELVKGMEDSKTGFPFQLYPGVA